MIFIKKDGFTIIELLIAISIGLIFVYNVIFIPINLIQNYNQWKEEYDIVLSLEKVNKIILDDIHRSNGIIIEFDKNVLKIGNNNYLFMDDGLAIIKNEKTLKISDVFLSYEIDEDYLHILKDGEIYLSYNLEFSSFEKVGEINE